MLDRLAEFYDFWKAPIWVVLGIASFVGLIVSVEACEDAADAQCRYNPGDQLQVKLDGPVVTVTRSSADGFTDVNPDTCRYYARWFDTIGERHIGWVYPGEFEEEAR